MKVIAKDDIGYDEYPYVNWRKGITYNCELKHENHLDITDEQGVVFHFSGWAKDNLNQVFDFVE